MNRDRCARTRRVRACVAVTAGLGLAALAGAAPVSASPATAATAGARETGVRDTPCDGAHANGVTVHFTNLTKGRGVRLWIFWGRSSSGKESRDLLYPSNGNPAQRSNRNTCWGYNPNGKTAVRASFKWDDGNPRGFTHEMGWGNPPIGWPWMRCCASRSATVGFKSMASHSWTQGDMKIEAQRVPDVSDSKTWNVTIRQLP